MNELFSWKRLGMLIRNDFVAGYRLYLNAFAVLGIAMLLNAIPAAGFGHLKEGFYYGWFAGLMVVWGSIHASLMFTELYDKRRNEAWLLLPASALEKTLSRYLNGSLFFILHIVVFVTAAALVIELFNLALFGRSNGLFNPFSREALEAIGTFMVIQPIFFLGGVWFRNARWFKTVMTVFIINFGLTILACFTFLLMFAGHFDELHYVFSRGFQDIDWEASSTMFDGVITGMKIICYGVLPPFCVYVSWLRVRETQVSYGV